MRRKVRKSGISSVFAHPWYCGCCRRLIPEHHARLLVEDGVQLFYCPVCRFPLGARFLF